MSDEKKAHNIIIKKKKKGHHGHHGGAWKIAYADFVTAMMAFFLMMWLLNATSEEQKRGISNYFSPNFLQKDNKGGGTNLVNITDITSSSKNTNIEDESILTNNEGALSSDAKEKITNTEILKSNKEKSQPDPNDKEFDNAIKLKANEQNKDEHKSGNPPSPGEVEEKRFKDILKEIKTMIQNSPDLKMLLNNIIIEDLPEGLRIQIVDAEKQAMFPSGSSQLLLPAQNLLDIIAKSIVNTTNKLSVSGHTDAVPYSNTRDYGNWELSTDRANASRRFLEFKGINKERFANVVGRASTQPLLKDDPNSPRNRRINILLIRENPLTKP